MIQPTIVVIAFNREKPLSRLLESLSQASYPDSNIRLHISIDGNENESVIDLVNSFVWAHGEKIVTINPERLGLKKHVLQCGDLAEKYENIIVLEDDLFVSKGFYNYALQAREFYSNEPKVAGISLYTYSFEENNFFPFVPVKTTGDVHFIRLASSWGQLWSKNHWLSFKTWLKENPNGKDSILPKYMVEWGNNSWKKLFNAFLISSDKYFVFPNHSFSSNFEEAGTHATNTGLFQVPLNLGDSILDFCSFNESNSVYDEYYELMSSCLKRLNPKLINFDFDTDLFGAKPLEKLTAKYVLTCKTGKEPEVTFGSSMTPLLQNVIFNVEGATLGLYKKSNLLPTKANRFLYLTESNVRQEQLIQLENDYKKPCSVIIPVKDNQIGLFLDTISNLQHLEQDFFSIIVVSSKNIQMELRKILSTTHLNVLMVSELSQNEDQMLRHGISKVKTGYCAWIQPGMTIDPKKIKGVAQIFREMRPVQIIIGVDKENTGSSKSLAPYRWNPERALYNIEEFKNVRTELIFWRKSILMDIDQLTTENLILTLLKSNPIYTVDLKIGNVNNRPQVKQLNSKEIVESLSEFATKRKNIVKRLLQPISEKWFNKNSTYLRSFFKESMQLPLVIRYDKKNESFYLSDY